MSDIHFDSYRLLSDVNDQDALQRSLDALVQTSAGRLILPNREIIAPGEVSIVGANRKRIVGQGKTVLLNTSLNMVGCYDCKLESISMVANTQRSKAILLETCTGSASGQNSFIDIRIEGQYTYGIETKDSSFAGNNDFHTFDRLTVHNTSLAGVHIGNAMSVGNMFKNCYLTGGEYGVHSIGSFIWSGGRMSGHTVSDFRQVTVNSVPGQNRIFDCNSENSARFYVTYVPPSTTSQLSAMPVSMDSVRFALNNAACDASDNFDGTDFVVGLAPSGDKIGVATPVYGKFRGPFTIQNCRWGNGSELSDNPNGVKRVKLILAGGGVVSGKGGIIQSNVIVTNNINAPIVDQGLCQQNLGYVWTSQGIAETWYQ